MLGGPAVGKSSLVSQFMTSEYLHAYDTSIGEYSQKPPDPLAPSSISLSVSRSISPSLLIATPNSFSECCLNFALEFWAWERGFHQRGTGQGIECSKATFTTAGTSTTFFSTASSSSSPSGATATATATTTAATTTQTWWEHASVVGCYQYPYYWGAAWLWNAVSHKLQILLFHMAAIY